MLAGQPKAQARLHTWRGRPRGLRPLPQQMARTHTRTHTRTQTHRRVRARAPAPSRGARPAAAWARSPVCGMRPAAGWPAPCSGRCGRPSWPPRLRAPPATPHLGGARPVGGKQAHTRAFAHTLAHGPWVPRTRPSGSPMIGNKILRHKPKQVHATYLCTFAHTHTHTHTHTQPMGSGSAGCAFPVEGWALGAQGRAQGGGARITREARRPPWVQAHQGVLGQQPTVFLALFCPHTGTRTLKLKSACLSAPQHSAPPYRPAASVRTQAPAPALNRSPPCSFCRRTTANATANCARSA